MVESLTVESLLSDYDEPRLSTNALARASAARTDLQTYWSTPEEYALVAITSCRGIIIYVNDRFCEVSGYSRQELIGVTHGRVASGRHSHRFWRDLWGTIGAGRLWRGEICNCAHDGTEYWIESIIRPLRRDERIFGYIAVSRLSVSALRRPRLSSETTLQSLRATG